MNNCIINKKQIQRRKAPYHSIHWGVLLRAAWAGARVCCSSIEGRSTSFQSSVTTSKSSLTWDAWLKSCPCTEGSGLKARITRVSIENVFNSVTDRHLANTNAFGPQCVTQVWYTSASQWDQLKTFEMDNWVLWAVLQLLEWIGWYSAPLQCYCLIWEWAFLTVFLSWLKVH